MCYKTDKINYNFSFDDPFNDMENPQRILSES